MKKNSYLHRKAGGLRIYPSDAKGIAIPYVIYDFCHNEEFINLGARCDTAEFAMVSIGIWRKRQYD